jgi:acyl-CoA thioester hydrolase
MPDQTHLYHDASGKTVVETRFRVRYHETDAMGIVHHAAYITWFEEGRSSLTRAVGCPYSQVAAEGIDFAVVDVAARYLKPAHYDDEVIVVTRLEELRSRSMTFSYEVRLAGGQLLVTGSTRHVSVDRSGRVASIPETIRARLQGGRNV